MQFRLSWVNLGWFALNVYSSLGTMPILQMGDFLLSPIQDFWSLPLIHGFHRVCGQKLKAHLIQFGLNWADFGCCSVQRVQIIRNVCSSFYTMGILQMGDSLHPCRNFGLSLQFNRDPFYGRQRLKIPKLSSCRIPTGENSTLHIAKTLIKIQAPKAQT